MSLIRFAFAVFLSFLASASQAQNVKALIDDFVVRDAETFENALASTWPTKGKDAKGWRADGVKASGENDHRAATGFFASAALLDKNNGEVWLQLAREYLAIETEKYSEKNTFAKNAGSSAYIAYTRGRSKETQGQALAVLAESLGVRGLWRSALRTYKASLALDANSEVQEQYEEAFNEHGFRMLDYTADNESNAPRICVQFSENLAKG